MKRQCLFALAAGFVFCSQHAFAQAPTDAWLHTNPAANGTVNGVFYVTIPDTNQVQELEVRLGTNEGAHDLLMQAFPFDSNTGLPAGMTWFREGQKVTLNLGTFADTGVQFGEVRTKDQSGNWTAPYRFVTN